MLKAALRLHFSDLHRTDCYWALDEAMLKFMCGADGASAIKALFEERCLCSQTRHVEIADAVTAANELCTGTGVNWSGAAVKAE
eukprot:4133810-Amphidinium_carterae.2